MSVSPTSKPARSRRLIGLFQSRSFKLTPCLFLSLQPISIAMLVLPRPLKPAVAFQECGVPFLECCSEEVLQKTCDHVAAATLNCLGPMAVVRSKSLMASYERATHGHSRVGPHVVTSYSWGSCEQLMGAQHNYNSWQPNLA